MSSIALDPNPLANLKEERFCKLAFPLDRATLERAMEAFMEFLALPEEVKEVISFEVNPSHRRGDIGYTHRSPEQNANHDDKQFFHYHPAILERYQSFLEEQPVVARFVQQAEPVWQAARDVVREFLASHTETFNGVDKGIFVERDPHIQVRFLKYFYQEPGRHLAKGHYDCGTCTLAIAESAPGLRIGKDERELQAVEHKEGEAIFMMGRSFPEVASPEFLPSWHDVVQLGDTIETEAFSRWALVAFFTVTGSEAKSWDENHKPI